jgi:CO dehydrogenase/acetyl-CoA synthase delta subunit
MEMIQLLDALIKKFNVEKIQVCQVKEVKIDLSSDKRRKIKRIQPCRFQTLMTLHL